MDEVRRSRKVLQVPGDAADHSPVLAEIAVEVDGQEAVVGDFDCGSGKGVTGRVGKQDEFR